MAVWVSVTDSFVVFVSETVDTNTQSWPGSSLDVVKVRLVGLRGHIRAPRMPADRSPVTSAAGRLLRTHRIGASVTFLQRQKPCSETNTCPSSRARATVNV